jgi:hypothetical protein
MNSMPRPRGLTPALARSCARLDQVLTRNTRSKLSDYEKLRIIRFQLFGRIAEEQPQS